MQAASERATWPGGPGEMAGRIRDFDWAGTPLGPIERWPPSLRTVADLMLGARQPVYVAWGPDLTSLYNDGSVPILGAKHPGGLGRPFAELWAEIWDEFRPLVAATMAGEAQYFVDQPVALAGRPDRPMRWFTFSWTPIRDEAGAVAGFYSAATETTEKVLAEAALRERQAAALREREARLRLALDLAELGTWAWDLSTGEGDLDARGAEIVGLPPGPLADVAAAQLASIHPDDLARTMADVETGIASGGDFDLAYRVVHPDQGVRHVASRARAFVDAAGHPVRLLGTNRDVTAEREAEAALRASEERYRTLFESIDQGFCTVEVLFDDGGRPIDYVFREINPAFARNTDLVGAVGKQMRELAPGHEEHWFHIYGEVARTGKPRRFEAEAAALGRWYNVYAFRVGDPSQHRVAILFEDVTERKRAEAEREAFVAAAAHDLKTPLTSIRGQAQLLRRRVRRGQAVEPAALESGLAAIEAAVGRMAALVDEMLDAAHLSAGRAIELRQTPTDLVSLAEAAAEEARRGAVARAVRVEAETPALVGEWDAARLARVLANLLSNAVKYSPAGSEVVVRVEREEGADGSGWATVAVRDRGIGIPAADLPRLFERFHRGANVAGRTRGTGIGLAGACQIVEQHGGTIDVESAEGRGSTFTVRLPLARQG